MPHPVQAQGRHLLGTLSLILCGLPAAAQATDLERELTQLLNTPVVTATRTAQSSGRAPATVVTVTSDQIARRHYRSLGELLADLPEFKVDRGFSSEYYNTVSIRGVMGQYKFVILMDGVRIGAATNEVIPVLENFPVHYAKQVEVVYGPASALYGADAFTGIINIVTFQDEQGSKNNHVRASGGTQSQFDTALFWSTKVGSSTYLSVGAQGFSDQQPDMPSYYPDEYRGLQQALDSGVFNTVFGVKHATIPYEKSYSQPIRANNFMMRMKHNDLSLTFLQGWSRVPSAVNYAPPNALPIESAYVAARTQTFSASHSAQLTDKIALQSTLTARKYDVDPGSRYINLFHPNIEPGYKYAASISFRMEETLTWDMSEAVKLTGGLSTEALDATPWGANLASPVNTTKSISGQGINVVGAPIAADFYTIRSHSKGAFLQAQFTPNAQWALTLGARYDNDSRYGDTFNPRIGLVWTPTSTTTLKALFGTAFLAPSPYAAYRHYGGFYTTDGGQTYRSSYWRLPNPGLKPELAQTGEFSVRTFVTPYLSLSAVLYRSVYKDLHSPMADAGNTNLYGGTFKGWPVDYIEVTGNQGRETNTGGNLQLDLFSPLPAGGKLNLFAALSLVNGKVEDRTGHEVDTGYVTPRMFKLGGDMTWSAWTGSLVFHHYGTQSSNVLKANSTERETIPGFNELNVSLAYRFGMGECFLRVTNALDGRYKHINENAFSGDYEFRGMPQAPRRAELGVRFNF